MSQVPQPTLADIEAMIAAGEIPTDDVGFAQAALLLLNAIRAGGGGGSGITQLTGDVTAGPGSGSVPATVAKINGVAVTGAPSAGQVIQATGAAAASWQTPSGGSPGLPVWTFQAGGGVPASGKFTTDNTDPSAVNNITLSPTSKNGLDLTPFFANLFQGNPGAYWLFTGPTGKTLIFNPSTISTGPPIGLIGSFNVADAVALNGDYQISFAPSNNIVTSVNGSSGSITLLPPDTGYAADGDTGDKAAVVPSDAVIGAMQAPLNLLLAGFGDAFVALADSYKATKNSLLNNLRPNL